MRTKEELEQQITDHEKLKNLHLKFADGFEKEIVKYKKELEELNKPKRWKPEVRDFYWFINPHGEVVETDWLSDNYDKFRYKTRNCFKTEEEAEEELERIFFVNDVRDFIEEENDGWDFDLLKHREFYYINKYVSGSGKEILIEVEYSMNYNREWFQGTSDYKIFKSYEIGKKILAKFDNEKLIKYWI